MACWSATAVILLLLCLLAVAHSRPIEAEPATNGSSAVAVATEVLPSSDSVSTEVVLAGQESGLLQLPSEHSVVLYLQDAGAEDLGRQEEEEVMPVAEPDPDRAQPTDIDGEEELTKEPSTDCEQAEDDEELSRSHHDEDEEEEKTTKRLHHNDDGDDSDSDSDDDDLEEKARRWMKALKRRWFGHRQHHHHGHRHAQGEAAKQQADGKQKERGVMIWIKGLMNRF